jgi:MFS family permease
MTCEGRKSWLRSPEAAILLATFNLGTSQTMLFSVLPGVGRTLHVSEFQIVSIIVVINVVAIFTSPFWGRKSDLVGRRPLVVLGMGAIAVSSAALAVLIKLALDRRIDAEIAFLLMFFVRGIAAFATSAILPAVRGLMADLTSAEGRTKGMAKIGSSYLLGTIAGPAAAAFLIAIDMSVPLMVSAVLAASAVVMCIRLLPSRSAVNASPAGAGKVSFMDERVLRFLVFQACASSVLAASQQLGGFFVQDRLGVSPQSAAQGIGLALTAMSASAMLAQLYLTYGPRIRTNVLLLIGFLAMLVGEVFVFSASTHAAVCIGYSVLGAGYGLVNPAVTGGASLAVTKYEQGGLAGLQASVTAAGYIAAPLAGLLFYALSPTLPFVICALMMFACAGFCLVESTRHTALRRWGR